MSIFCSFPDLQLSETNMKEIRNPQCTSMSRMGIVYFPFLLNVPFPVLALFPKLHKEILTTAIGRVSVVSKIVDSSRTKSIPKSYPKSKI